MQASISFTKPVLAADLAVYGYKAGEYAMTPSGLAIFAIATGALVADTPTRVSGAGATGAAGISATPDVAVAAGDGIWLHVIGLTGAGDQIVATVA